MRRSNWGRIAGTWLLLSLLGCGCRAPGPNRGSLLLYAASSTTSVIEEIRDQYTRRTGQGIELNFAATATLATQIKSGAEADLFLAADERWAQELVSARGLVANRIDLLSNRLVVILPKEQCHSLKSPEDLLKASFEAIAIANPDSMVPGGLYAQEALTRLGLWERLRLKMVYGENVRSALVYVETRSVDAGIVYRTDALASSGVQLALQIAPSLHRQIRYPLLLLNHGSQRPAAGDLFDYLQSPEAAGVFRKHGFRLLSKTEPL